MDTSHCQGCQLAFDNGSSEEQKLWFMLSITSGVGASLHVLPEES